MLLIKSGCFFFITHVYKISDAEGCNFCGRIFVYFCLFVRLYTCTRLLLFLLWTYFRIFYFYQAFQTVLDYIHNILSPLHSYTFRVVFFCKEHSKDWSTKSLYKRSQMPIVMALFFTSQLYLLINFPMKKPVVIWQIF